MPDDILENGYKKLKAEYDRLGLVPGLVAKFGLHPAWNTIVGTGGCCGVAMSFRSNNPNYGDDETFFEAGELKPYVGASLFDVALGHMGDGVIRRRSIALAALNALSRPFVEESVMRGKGYNTVDDLSAGVTGEDVVAIVGYGGLVKEYAGRCKELHVTDMRPPEAFKTTIVGETIEYGPKNIIVHGADENEEVLSRADVVFITGSTLVNGTFESVVHNARNARVRCLYGSSAQLMPDVLFENGIDAVMSVAIVDPVQFEYDVMNESDMETALKKHQRKYFAARNGTL